MRLSDRCLVWLQDHLGTIRVHMKGTQDQDQTREGLKEREEEVSEDSYINITDMFAMRAIMCDPQPTNHDYTCTMDNSESRGLSK